MERKSLGRNIGTTSTAVQLTDEQREQLAAALGIDVQFVPTELGVLGVPRASGSKTEMLVGIPVDRAGQFSPALVIM